MPRRPQTEIVKSKLPDYMGGMTAVGIRSRKTGRTTLMAYISPDGKRRTVVSSFFEGLKIRRPRK